METNSIRLMKTRLEDISQIVGLENEDGNKSLLLMSILEFEYS